MHAAPVIFNSRLVCDHTGSQSTSSANVASERMWCAATVAPLHAGQIINLAHIASSLHPIFEVGLNDVLQVPFPSVV